MAKIVAFDMVNIQSWSKATETVKLSQDLVNVIIGDNETGKSVLFKVFRQMCFPNALGRTGRKDLIRENCSDGTLAMLLDTGHIIQFTIYPTKQHYMLIHPDKTNEQWTQDRLPDKIRDLLGWYIDEEFNILLNVIDLEMPLPLTESSAKFNARVLKFVIENEELSQTIASFNQWEKDIDKKRNSLQVSMQHQHSLLSVSPYRDSVPLQQNITRTRELIEAYEYFNPVYDSLTQLPTLPDTDFTPIPHIGTVMQARELVQSIQFPTIPNTNFKQVQHIDTLMHVRDLIQSIQFPTPPPSLPDMDKTQMDKIMAMRDTLTQVTRSVQIYINKGTDLKAHKHTGQELKDTLAQLKSQLKNCTECGQPLRGVV